MDEWTYVNDTFLLLFDGNFIEEVISGWRKLFTKPVNLNILHF